MSAGGRDMDRANLIAKHEVCLTPNQTTLNGRTEETIEFL